MTNLTTKNKIYIYSGISSLLFFGILIFLTIPMYNNILVQNQEIDDKRIQLEIYKQQRNNLEQTKKDYNQIKNNVESVSTIFISQDDILDVVDNFEFIANNNSITQNLTLGSIDNFDSDKNIEIRILLVGSWDNIINYIADIEQTNYYINLNNLNFTNNGNEVTLSFRSLLYSE